jgi:hypothetical protein
MSSGHTRGSGAVVRIGLLVASVVIAAGLAASPALAKKQFTDDFEDLIDECAFQTEGTHPYWRLEVGYRLVLEGKDGKEEVKVEILVTDDTEEVDGVTTRVVEERETKDGELAEISYNFFALCQHTNSIFYFGEDVEFYENGQVVSDEGSWRAGVNGAKAGIIMPGTVLLGSRYFQEIAPNDDAMDRAEHVSLDATVVTPDGTFENVLKVRETSPVERGKSWKYYAPGVGMIQDDDLKLTDHGFAPRPRGGTGR